MHQVQAILEYMQSWADEQLAESWDNVGLLVDAGNPVEKILVALDITKEVVEEAEQKGCQLIISHHPVIFKPLRTLNMSQPSFLLVQKGISAICMHTNLDAAEGGVNDVLANFFGLQNVQPFAELGRIGTIQPMSAIEFAKQCKTKLQTPVMLADAGKEISTVALVGGSGGDFFKEAALAGADCLLTGEASHHHGLDSVEMGLSVVVAGHFATEFPVVKEMQKRLSNTFLDMEVIVSEKSKAPFALVD